MISYFVTYVLHNLFQFIIIDLLLLFTSDKQRYRQFDTISIHHVIEIIIILVFFTFLNIHINSNILITELKIALILYKEHFFFSIIISLCRNILYNNYTVPQYINKRYP